MMRRLALALLVVAAAAGGAFAVEPDEMLDDPGLEARAREISSGLRCLVCQNQSIDDSNAELAHDLRVLVRERLVAGDSDAAVVDYVVARYGEFVLLRPAFDARTLLLWLSAPLILGAGALTIFIAARRRAAASDPLTDDEQQRIDALLRDEEKSDGDARPASRKG